MRVSLFTCILGLVAGAFAAPSPIAPRLKPFSTFDDVTVFAPPADYIIPRTLYARTVLLEHGELLATWENYSPENGSHHVYFPIYKSVDGGETWKHISNVYDQVNGWGLRYQPFLYELPEAFGGFAAGTVLLAGNSIPTNLSNTQIDLYASKDKGYTWEFVSHIAAGGEALPDNGLTPVWEPFLQLYENQMICFYSDQRDPNYGQKLVHQTSTDLRTWAPPVNDVTYDVYTDRPGMTTVTHLPNGKWMMTYEFGGGPGFSDYEFPVFYRISDSPLTFEEAEGLPVNASGSQPNGSPYLVWSPVGGKNGTIAVSSGCCSQLWVNQELGAEDAWVEVDTPADASYTRSLRVMNNPDHLVIIGGGPLGGTNNTVHLSVIDILATIADA